MNSLPRSKSKPQCGKICSNVNWQRYLILWGFKRVQKNSELVILMCYITTSSSHIYSTFIFW
jgi:hypothetical protein